MSNRGVVGTIEHWPRHKRSNCRPDCQDLNCPVCVGGLFMCVRCGSAEGATTTECPGEQIGGEQLGVVYSGSLDWTRTRGWHNPSSAFRCDPA